MMIGNSYYTRGKVIGINQQVFDEYVGRARRLLGIKSAGDSGFRVQTYNVDLIGNGAVFGIIYNDRVVTLPTVLKVEDKPPAFMDTFDRVVLFPSRGHESVVFHESVDITNYLESERSLDETVESVYYRRLVDETITEAAVASVYGINAHSSRIAYLKNLVDPVKARALDLKPPLSLFRDYIPAFRDYEVALLRFDDEKCREAYEEVRRLSKILHCDSDLSSAVTYTLISGISMSNAVVIAPNKILVRNLYKKYARHSKKKMSMVDFYFDYIASKVHWRKI